MPWFILHSFQVIAPFPLFTKDTTPRANREMEGKGEPGEGRMKETVLEGIASIALLPCGSISGHFIQLPHSVCYALHGTEITCERECSRGEDYRLIKLTISDYVTQREKNVIVELRGHDAARFCNVEHAHGWDNDVIRTLEKVEKKDKISVSFECETLKSDKAAEDHIRQFMPKLVGLGAVVNVGRLRIVGLDFESEDDGSED